MENFGKFCALLITTIVIFMVEGYIVMLLWEWLIVPVFKQPVLSLSESMALSLFIAYFKSKKYSDEDEERYYEKVVTIIIVDLIILLIAYIISSFI